MRPRKTPVGRRWKHHEPRPTITKPLREWIELLRETPSHAYRVASMNAWMMARIVEHLQKSFPII